MRHPLDKAPLASKRFVAYLVGEATWKALLFLLLAAFAYEPALVNVYTTLIGCFMVFIAGFCEVGYILGQSYTDRYLIGVDRVLDLLPVRAPEEKTTTTETHTVETKVEATDAPVDEPTDPSVPEGATGR